MKRKLFKFSMAVVLAVASAVSFHPTSAASGTNRYVATSGNDTGNNCTSIFSPCLTVTHAISESTGGDTINIAAGTYVEHIYVATDLTLIGAGMDGTILDGGGTGRVVLVSSTATISYLTIQNGHPASGSGGGLQNAGTLTLDHVQVRDNTATSGGGIANSGALTMTDSTVTWNHATVSGSGYGGGVFINSTGTTSMTNVTVAHNEADLLSGGIHFQGNGTLNLTNATIAGNSSDDNSALSVVGTSTANLLNSTISGNTSTGPGGSAIWGGTLSFKNTIVSANSPSNCDAGAGWTSLGYNLDSGNTCGFSGGGDQPNTDPQLTVLGDYGGAVWTMLLEQGSAAIDGGTNTGCPAEDARGLSRPVDGNNNAAATCDVGAVEMRAQTTTTSIDSVAPATSFMGQSVLVTVSVTGSLTTPTGGVEVDGDPGCTITLAAGSGSCSVVFSRPAQTGVFAHYTGDTLHDASQAALLHIVLRPHTDFDGDYMTEPAKYSSAAGAVYYYQSTTSTFGSTYIGTDGDYVLDSDFDGDGTTDPAKYVSAAGAIWYLGSADTTWHGVYIGSDGEFIPASDFDGDGKTDPAKYVAAAGSVWYLGSADSTWYGVYIGDLGGGEYIPGSDFDGDNKADPAKYVAGGVYWLKSTTGAWDSQWIGADGDYVPRSDYDGDGRIDPAKFVSPNIWYMQSGGGYALDFIPLGADTTFVVPGSDFDADGITDAAKFVYSAPHGSIWYTRSSDAGTVGVYMGADTYDIVN